MYLETLQEVLGRADKVIIDSDEGGTQGVVPFLALNELGRQRPQATQGGGQQ